MATCVECGARVEHCNLCGGDLVDDGSTVDLTRLEAFRARNAALEAAKAACPTLPSVDGAAHCPIVGGLRDALAQRHKRGEVKNAALRDYCKRCHAAWPKDKECVECGVRLAALSDPQTDDSKEQR